MVKQKVVIKLTMDDQKKRTKALKAAAGMDNIISTSIEGDKIVVVGDGFDSIKLTSHLRKKLGYAELVSVTSGDEKKKDDKPKDEAKSEVPVLMPPYYAAAPYMYPRYGYHEVSQYPDSCNIM